MTYWCTKKRTYGRTRVTVTLNVLAVVMVGATKFHKILIETIPWFREQTLQAYPVVVARISCHDKFSGKQTLNFFFRYNIDSQWFFYLRILHLLRISLSLGCKVLFQRVPGCNIMTDFAWKIVLWTHKFAVGLISVVPIIYYNQKSFVYMQPIDEWMEFWESIIIGKILKQKNFIFIYI